MKRKRSIRKCTSLLAAMCMLFSLLFGNVSTLGANNSLTVHFKSTWGSSYIYYWQTNPSTTTVNWPGVPMQNDGNNWYSYVLDVSSANLIFNNAKGSQTADLSRTSGEWWYMNGVWTDYNPEAPCDSQIVVHLKSVWSSPYIYYWGASPSLPGVSWPGVSMDKEDNIWYTYT